MRRTLYLLGVLVAVGVVGTVQITSTQSPAPASVAVTPATALAPTVANIATPALTAEEQRAIAALMSPERLAAMRARVHGEAQRAVRDEAEQGFREPTAAEAAALAGPRTEAAASEVPLPGGGAAIKADVSSLEFVRGTLDKSGAVVTHDGKGARRDQ